MPKITVTLTPVEISHILTALAHNQEEGWYYGPKAQYWKRHERIVNKLYGQEVIKK